MVKLYVGIGILFSLVSAPYVFAQSTEESTKLTAQDLIFEADKKHTEEFHKYFFFHKQGVTYDQALDDFAECNIYQNGPVGSEGDTVIFTPSFVSLSESQSYTPRLKEQKNNGIIGDAIVSLVGDITAAPILLKYRSQRLRKCMEYKNYDRYGLSKDKWRLIHQSKTGNFVKISASIASGPAPKTEKILP